jgi:hypothetical protein
MPIRLLVVAACLVFVPVVATAQTPRGTIAPGNTVLVAAYNCAADQLAQADTLVNEVAAPILNKHVTAGKLLNWGYMGVYVGDQNNRSIYVWAADPVALVQARAVYLPEINGNQKFQEFVKICGSATITMHNLITTSPTPGK